jgi:lysophospholipase L1-like esterase
MFGRKQKSPFVVVAIGDSLIEGKSATENRGWVQLFAANLQAEVGQIELHNLGDGGDNIFAAKKMFESKWRGQKADLCILGIGVNDSRYRPSMESSEVPIRGFRRELASLIRKLKRCSRGSVIVSGQVPVIDRLTDPYKEDKHYRRSLQINYERALWEIAQAEEVHFLDHFVRWSAFGDQFIEEHLADGLHPNDAGHEDLSRYALEYFKLRCLG